MFSPLLSLAHMANFTNHPRRGRRREQLCACGCGQQTSEALDKDGRFRGYKKYVAGHISIETKEKRRLGIRAARVAHTKPDFSRRITNRGNNSYWEIKVPNHRRWKLEHRHIIEEEVGRTLRTNEHVHHIDGDGLNNSRENLVLMSASDHTRLTGKQYGGPSTFMKGKPHRCPVCRSYHDWPK